MECLWSNLLKEADTESHFATKIGYYTNHRVVFNACDKSTYMFCKLLCHSIPQHKCLQNNTRQQVCYALGVCRLPSWETLNISSILTFWVRYKYIKSCCHYQPSLKTLGKLNSDRLLWSRIGKKMCTDISRLSHR